MKKVFADKPVHFHCVMSRPLHDRLTARAAKESFDRRRTVTPSEIVRWAVEEYLDMWETATFVPDEKGA